MTHRETWLVSVTAGRWQRHGIQEAKKAGLRVIAVDIDPNAEGFQDADIAMCCDPLDVDGLARRLGSLDTNISGAIGFCSEVGVHVAGRLRDMLKLPGPGQAVCHRLLDKAVQRGIWAQTGVPGPSWKVVASPEEALADIAQFGFPLIIKPTDSAGSRGVTKLESNSDDIHDAVSRAFKYSRAGNVLLESYMEGTEFTVEILADCGTIHVLAVTEKKKVEGTRGTVAYELASPDRPYAILHRISSSVVAAYESLGYTDGPGHAEVILRSDDSVGLVEVAGRGGGFLVFDRLVPLVSNINIARISALQAVGVAAGAIECERRAAVLRFVSSRPGVLRSVSGFEQASLIRGVECGSFVKVGDRLSRAVADGDRLGYVLSCAPTPAEAQRLADLAESMIHFDIAECQ